MALIDRPTEAAEGHALTSTTRRDAAGVARLGLDHAGGCVLATRSGKGRAKVFQLANYTKGGYARPGDQAAGSHPRHIGAPLTSYSGSHRCRYRRGSTAS